MNKPNKTRHNKRHDTFTDILHAILTLHTEFPSWRFGQVVANAIREWDGRINCDPFHIQDEELLSGLDSLLDEFKQLDNYKGNEK